MAVIAAFDFGIQMAMNGLNIRCVSWSSVVISGTLGAAGAVGYSAAMGGALKWVGGFRNGRRANSAFPRGIEYLERSHFWPGRWGGTFSSLNINRVPGTVHAMTDRMRLQFMRTAWREANGALEKLLTNSGMGFLYFRVPWWFSGAVAGGGTGAKTSAKCECE